MSKGHNRTIIDPVPSLFYLFQRAVDMYDGARVPSPEASANGAPGAATRPNGDEEPEEEEAVPPKPVLVKTARREILDHERKRRVELKCMELQEMMEEQG